MSEYSLCASTFFYLLLSARNGGISSRTPSQTACFRAFINIADPQAVAGYKENSDLSSLKPHASHLRNANPDGKTNYYMHFGLQLTADEFESKLINNTEEVFKDIDDYFSKYTTNTEFVKTWLVKQLLGLIEKDDEIKKNKFVIQPKFIQSYKEEVLKEKSINFYYFIAGIWLYIYRYNENYGLGKSTIELWDSMTDNPDLMEVGNTYDDVVINFDKQYEAAKEDNSIETALRTEMHYEKKFDGSGFHPEYFLKAFADRLSELNVGKMKKYVSRVKEDYGSCFTFRYRVKTPFYDFYVCSDIRRRIISPISFIGKRQDSPRLEEPISDVEFDSFNGNQIMIIGSGGYGKSMLMRHLLLSCTKKRPDLVPIFVMLGKFNADSEDGLMDLIYDEMNILGTDISLSDISELFATGTAALFLDGFDEIPQEHRDKFVKALNKMTRRYNESTYILSSRNNPHVDSIDGFTKYDIQPLSEEQAKAMINKLVWATDDLKKNIIADIESNRFRLAPEEKKTFLGNPLFLSIIVATYQYTHNIQTKRYLFYDDAYRVMYKEHDGVKGLTRPYDTGLDEDEFKLRFGEFCAYAFSEGQSKFERETFEGYFQEVIDANGLDVSVEDFSSDIVDKLCLMYEEGNTYHWVHRSFQEYLAAYFFSQQVDARFGAITDIFIDMDAEGELHDDETLPMMFGLNREKAELSVILPYLRRVVIGYYDENETEEVYMTAYHDFIEEFYPSYTFYTGDVSGDEVTTEHAVYNFICEQYDLKKEISEDDFDGLDMEESSFAKKLYSRNTGRVTEKGYPIYETCELSDLTEDQQYSIEMDEECDDVDYAGAEIELDFRYIFDTGRKYNQDVIDCIDSPNFALRKEFDAVIKLVRDLKTKYTKKKKGTFLSKFH